MALLDRQSLDEPISETICKEFSRICAKMKCVLLPSTAGPNYNKDYAKHPRRFVPPPRGSDG